MNGMYNGMFKKLTICIILQLVRKSEQFCNKMSGTFATYFYNYCNHSSITPNHHALYDINIVAVISFWFKLYRQYKQVYGPYKLQLNQQSFS